MAEEEQKKHAVSGACPEALLVLKEEVDFLYPHPPSFLSTFSTSRTSLLNQTLPISLFGQPISKYAALDLSNLETVPEVFAVYGRRGDVDDVALLRGGGSCMGRKRRWVDGWCCGKPRRSRKATLVHARKNVALMRQREADFSMQKEGRHAHTAAGS